MENPVENTLEEGKLYHLGNYIIVHTENGLEVDIKEGHISILPLASNAVCLSGYKS